MKAGVATTLFLMAALVAGAQAGFDYGNYDFLDKLLSKINFKPSFQPVYKQQTTSYYCVYFYYQQNSCPSNWQQSYQSAVQAYAQQYPQNVYGCSFGNNYNYGYQIQPQSQGGYVCFKTQSAPMHFYNWFQSTQYCQGFASYSSPQCSYKIVQTYNAPPCQYTY